MTQQQQHWGIVEAGAGSLDDGLWQVFRLARGRADRARLRAVGVRLFRRANTRRLGEAGGMETADASALVVRRSPVTTRRASIELGPQ
jgi:hypothetical protein